VGLPARANARNGAGGIFFTAGLADLRPGLAQVALALARPMDNPRAVSSKPAAAKVLASLLDRLRGIEAWPWWSSRGGSDMTEKGGA